MAAAKLRMRRGVCIRRPDMVLALRREGREDAGSGGVEGRKLIMG
jgi:hypothetical protein